MLACKYYAEAARRGHVEAMCNLGAILADYKGSQKAAVMWTRRAAMRGDDIAMSNLGRWYASGECGLRANRRLAMKWLSKSAEKGNRKAAKKMENLLCS